MIQISYVPFILHNHPEWGGTHDVGKERLKEVLEVVKSTDAMADGCIWVDDDGVAPILLFECVSDLFGDMNYWSQGNPEEWFTIDIAQRGEKYTILLMPDLKKSAKRNSFRHFTEYEEIAPFRGAEILFKPIGFVSDTSTTYNIIKDKIGKSMKIGFYNVSEFDPEDAVGSINEDRIHWTKPLVVRINHPSIKRMFDDLFN